MRISMQNCKGNDKNETFFGNATGKSKKNERYGSQPKLKTAKNEGRFKNSGAAAKRKSSCK